GGRHGRDQASADPGAVDLEGVDLAAELSLHTGPILVPLEGERIVDLHAGVEAETAEGDHRHRRRPARLEEHEVDGMVDAECGDTVKSENLLRRRTLNDVKRRTADHIAPV